MFCRLEAFSQQTRTTAWSENPYAPSRQFAAVKVTRSRGRGRMQSEALRRFCSALHQPCPCGYENTRVSSRILRREVASLGCTLALPNPCAPVPIPVIQITVIAYDKDGDPIQGWFVDCTGQRDGTRAARYPLVLPDPSPVVILVIQMTVVAHYKD